MTRLFRQAALLAVGLVAMLAPAVAQADFAQTRITHFGADGDLAQQASFPGVAYNSQTNQFLVVYLAGPNADNHHWTVFGQMVDASGNPVGGQITVSAPTANEICEDDPATVAYSATLNEFLVSWSEGTAAGCDDSIFAQRVGADGALLSMPSQQISGIGFSDTETTDIAFNSNGNEWLVAWKSDHPTTGFQELFAQRLGADGAEVGENDKQLTDFNTPGGNANDAMSVAFDPADSRYLVVVRGTDPTALAGNMRSETWGHLMGGDLSVVGADHFRISHVTATNATGDSKPPSVGYDPVDNRFLVAWTGNPKLGTMLAGENEIGARLVAADGSLIGTDDMRLSDMGPDGSTLFMPQRPDIGFNPNAKEFFLSWSGDDDTAPLVDDESEVFGQRVSAEGAEVGDNDFRISHYGTDGDKDSAANRPVLGYNSSSCQYLVTWASGDVGNFGGATDEWDIYANLVDSPCPPVNKGLPTITGTAKEGQALTCTDGAWSGRGMTFSRAWLRDGVAIASATNPTYSPTATDATHQVACRVTATDPDGTANATSAAVVPTALPAVVTPPPPPADKTAPVCKLSVPKQKLKNVLKKGLRVRASCNEAAALRATLKASYKVPRRSAKAAKVLTISTRSVKLTKPGQVTITLKITKKAKKALAKVKKVSFGVRVSAKDTAGNSARPLTKTVTLKKK